ncbi:MAG: aminotransferase class V-fold PLP-dependent enzyme [Clostridia bacterium]|nr:aminotransferase class V-fold PLP-dependent enzyme [Clostridia bacterium]
MIYFDNAATGGFKPFKSVDAGFNAMKNLNANAGRSGHKLSLYAGELVYETRRSLAKFFDTTSDRIVFTASCTEALNVAIFGMYEKGSHVVTTVTEHNAVLRPLYELERRNEISLSIIKPSVGGVSVEDVKNALEPNTKLVVLNAVSNVNGLENDVDGIGKFLKNRNITFIVDGAQRAGHNKTQVNNQLIDAFCIAGHKGLLASQGIGVLVLGKNAEVRPLLFGGTGSDSFSERMPDYLPEKLEAGTLNLPAICSLKAGLEYVDGNEVYIASQLFALTENLITRLSRLPFIKLYSIPNKYGIVSFSHSDFPSQELAQILSDRYDIAVRGGFHCAPLMHKFLKTDKLGTVRVSFAPQNTRREINSLISALKDLSLNF